MSFTVSSSQTPCTTLAPQVDDLKPEWSENYDDEGWTLVTRRRGRRKHIQMTKPTRMRISMVDEEKTPIDHDDSSDLSHGVCTTEISFNDEDLLLGSKLHNRPLFIKGYVDEKIVNRILVDDGSAVNILPLKTMRELGIPMDELFPSHLMIQGLPDKRSNGFDPNAYKLLARAGYSQEDINKILKDGDMTQLEGKQVFAKTSKAWREKKTSSKTLRAGLGYESSTPLYFHINKEASWYINVEEVKDKQQSQPTPLRVSVWDRLGGTTSRAPVFTRIETQNKGC
ncbi:ty3-gypsy retrotransposon protein [Salix suchowensis]|nr:ty3-gypsy retrotransposon protein [Salix suchowensis]